LTAHTHRLGQREPAQVSVEGEQYSSWLETTQLAKEGAMTLKVKQARMLIK
jgi:hypothetical protein